MELKSGDVIELTFEENSHLNGYFLISEINDAELKVRKPPNEHYTFSILNEEIVGVTNVVLVYSAPVYGIAIKNNFIPGKTIVIVYKADPEEKLGLIKGLEEDMIEVEINDKTVFIDFGYVGFPDEIQSIVLDEGFVIEEGDELFLPESEHRFTLDRQISDLMDKLLSAPNQTHRTIQKTKQIVQRFRELRSLFSTNTLDPVQHPENYIPPVDLYKVKWVIPVSDIQRDVYNVMEETDHKMIRNLVDIQENKNGLIPDGSYNKIYKLLLESFLPYQEQTNSSEVKDLSILLPEGRVVQQTAKDYYTTCKKKWIVQVLNKPYSASFKTDSERVDFSSYFVVPELVDYTRAFIPNTELIQKVKSISIAPYISLIPSKHKHKSLQECSFNVQSILSQNLMVYSVQSYIKQLSPLLIFKNDVTHAFLTSMIPLIQKNIKHFKKNVKESDYLPNPLIDHDGTSASEWQVKLLHEDNGSLYAIREAQKFAVDYTNKIDDYIQKTTDVSQTIAPPIAKEYTSINQLKEKGIIVYDEDKFDATEYEPYDTPETMIDYLVKEKGLTPEQAYIHAPYLLKKQRIVVNGDYAKLKNTYYKRVNNEWKLDETCYGPYPCMEPNVTFRLKQNLMTSILTDYEIGMYADKVKYSEVMKKKEVRLKQKLEDIKEIRYRTKLKYDKKFSDLGESLMYPTTSPNEPLFLYILQKPYSEKYKELDHFIKSRTRTSFKEENADWLYCIVTNVKLVPTVFLELIDGYNENTYKATLDHLKQQNLLQEISANIVTVTGGFVVEAIDFVQTFDDTVRSTELSESIIMPYREENILTPIILDVLGTIMLMIKEDISLYFNYMIHKIIQNKSILLRRSIALVLKISNIVKNLVIQDKIQLVLKNIEKLYKILEKYDLKKEVVTMKDIENEIKMVSGFYEIQTILREKDKKIVVKPTLSTIWSTFLPPYIRSKEPSGVMKIIDDIQEVVSKKIIASIKQESPLIYTKNKQFHQLTTQLSIHSDVRIIFFPKLDYTLDSSRTKDYSSLLPDIKNVLDTYLRIKFPDNVPLLYLRTFIFNIARAFPKFMMTNVQFDYQVPLSLDFLSESHEKQLDTIKTHFSELRKFKPTGLERLIADPEIDDVLKKLLLPINEYSEYEYKYYVYVIFLKYIEFTKEKQMCIELLHRYMKMLQEDTSHIFISYEKIKIEVLKYKAVESNEIRLKQNTMSADDKAVFSFKQARGLDEHSRVGRQRDYDAAHHDRETTMFDRETDQLTEINDADNGSDGNEYDD